MARKPSSPLRVGLVGAGYFSEFHLRAWQQIKDAELVAVCDVDAGKAEELAKKYSLPSHFSSMAKMIQTDGLDLVDLATPPGTHRHLVKLAVDHQVPVICQKPFGLNYAEAVELADYAQAAGVPLVVHENFRFMPWYRSIRTMLDEGQLGRLHGISFRLRPGDGQGPLAYLDRQPYFQKMPRLLIVETAIHFIDTFRYLMGDVDAVYARLRRLNPHIQGEDSAVITFEFSSSAIGVFDGNRLNDMTAENPRRTMGELWIEGDKGVLRMDGDGRLWFKPHHADEVACNNPLGDLNAYGGGACQALQQRVVQGLLQGTPLENTARDYLRNLLIQEAIYASHQKGCRIALNNFIPAEIPTIPQF